MFRCIWYNQKVAIPEFRHFQNLNNWLLNVRGKLVDNIINDNLSQTKQMRLNF